MNAHETDWKALGLPNQGSCFNWRVHQAPKIENTRQRNARKNRERYQAGESAKQRAAKVLTVNRESNVGYSHQAATDRNLKIKGRA